MNAPLVRMLAQRAGRILTFCAAIVMSSRIVYAQTVPPGYEIVDITSNNGHRFGPIVCREIESMDLFLYDGSEVRRITTSGQTYGYANQGAEINDLGEIVWTEYDFCDPPPGYNFTSRTMLYSAGQIEALATAGVGPQAPDINNRSQVVWDAYDPSTGGYFVELWYDGQTTLLTDDGLVPTINDMGVVVFNRLDPGRQWWDIWFWRDGTFSQVTADLFDNIVPRVNNAGEATWGHGTNHLRLNTRLLRRFNEADLNCDGVIDAFDIEGFVIALVDPQRYRAAYPTCDLMLGDLNADGAVNAFDIEPFLERLLP